MEHTGRYGRVNLVNAIRKWSIEEGYTTVKQVSSNTANGMNRNKGIFDWTGSYEAYGTIPYAMPGESQTFSGYKAPDAAGVLSTGQLFGGNIYIISSVITVNFATNDLISYVNTFGGNGDLTVSAGTQPADATLPTDQVPSEGKVTVYDGTTETRLENITQAVLTFTREAKTAVNSGSITGTGKATTKRLPGAAIDWSLALTSEKGIEEPLLATGTITEFRIYVNATQYWKLQWGILGKRTGLVVDVEGGVVISQVHNAEMKGYNLGAKGSISKPGAISFW